MEFSMRTPNTALATVVLAVSAWLGTVAIGAPASSMEMTVGAAGVLAESDFGARALHDAAPSESTRGLATATADTTDTCLLRRMFEPRIAL